MSEPPPSEWLSPQDFAQLAGLSLSTVRRRIHDGTLPHWQPGGKRTAVRIPRGALSVSPPDSSSASALSPTNAPPKSRTGQRPRWLQNSR